MRTSRGRVIGRSDRGILTERDLEVLRWLGRHRLATAEQVARRFGMERAKAYRRLRILADGQLVRYEPGIRSRRVYLATRIGLRTVNLTLPPATVSAASFAHDIAVVEVAIDLENRVGCDVISERELREEGATYTLRPDHNDLTRHRRGRWPDLVIEGYPNLDSRVAIEVELTRKKQQRVLDKLLAYLGSQYTGVMYLTPTEEAARRIRAWAHQIGASHLIHARTLPDAVRTHG